MKEFIFWLMACFLSTYGITFLFCKVSEVKGGLSYKSMFIFVIGVLYLSISKYYGNKITYSYFIFYPILYYSICKIKLRRMIIITLIIWLIGTFLDLISMLFSSLVCLIFNIDLIKYYNVFTLSLSVLVVLVFIIIGSWNKTRNLLIKVINYLSDIEYSNFTLIVFCIFNFILALCIFFNLDRIKVDVLIFIIILLLVFSFILLIKFRINDVENKKYLKTLKENNDFYIRMDDENRIFKHNLIAKLSSIKSVSNKKAIALIDDFVIKNNKGMNYSKKMKTIPYGLNGIIHQKTYPYLEDINFKLINKINTDIFKVLKPRRYNVLVEKLMVSLDNAIESSLNSRNKVVVISLYDDEENIYVEIKNSFAHIIDVDNLGSLNYSTKGKRRGLGLFSIEFGGMLKK